jgi:hypothetical protein
VAEDDERSEAALPAFVRREIEELLGADAVFLRDDDLGGLQREARRWHVSPWTDAKIAGYLKNRGRAALVRKAFEAAIAGLEWDLALQDPATREGAARIAEIERTIDALEQPLVGETLMPLRLGDTHRVQPWALDARLIADEIWKLRQRLDRRLDRLVRERLDAAELRRVSVFLFRLFREFGERGRHPLPSTRKAIGRALAKRHLAPR